MRNRVKLADLHAGMKGVEHRAQLYNFSGSIKRQKTNSTYSDGWLIVETLGRIGGTVSADSNSTLFLNIAQLMLQKNGHNHFRSDRDGGKSWVFLTDQVLQREKIGMFSTSIDSKDRRV